MKSPSYYIDVSLFSLQGQSVNGFDLKGKQYPLVYEQSVAKCNNESLVKGKIVVCSYAVGSEVAVAFIFRDKKEYSLVSPWPISSLSLDDFGSLISYINSTK